MGVTALRRYWRQQAEAITPVSEPVTESATFLPEDFPAYAKLQAAGLTTFEAVRANLGDLRKLGLTKREAEQVEEAL